MHTEFRASDKISSFVLFCRRKMVLPTFDLCVSSSVPVLTQANCKVALACRYPQITVILGVSRPVSLRWPFTFDNNFVRRLLMCNLSFVIVVPLFQPRKSHNVLTCVVRLDLRLYSPSYLVRRNSSKLCKRTHNVEYI